MQRHRAVVLIVALLASLAAPSVSAAESRVVVDVPTAAEVGEPVEIVVRAPVLADARAAEVRIVTDGHAATLTGGHAPQGDGRLALGPVASPDGMAAGFISCRPDVCGDAVDEPPPDRRDRTDPLVSFEVTATRPGTLRLEIAPITVVIGDVARQVPVGDAVHTVAVTTDRDATPALDVAGGAGVRPGASAPSATPGDAAVAAGSSSDQRSPEVATVRLLPSIDRDALESAAATFARAEKDQPELSGVAVAADITGDRDLTPPDLMAATLAWESSRSGAPDAATTAEWPDLLADGVRDVADLQVVADVVRPAPQAGGDDDRAPFVVTTTSDTGDEDIGDGRCLNYRNECTLRAALQESNALPGSDRIHFAIPGDGVHTIRSTKALPPLADPTGGTTIDGSTQPGSRRGGVADRVIRIAVRGMGPVHDGLRVASDDNVLRGLAAFDHRVEIRIHGPAAGRTRVEGMFVGTDPSGTFGEVERVVGDYGIAVRQGASGTQIGRYGWNEENLISGNGDAGISVGSESTGWTEIHANTVGLHPSGTKALPNRGHGIEIHSDSYRTTVGGWFDDEFFTSSANVIAGNDGAGIDLRGVRRVDINTAVIGVEVPSGGARSSSSVLGNGGAGIRVAAGSSGILIVFTRSVGNGGPGIELNRAGWVTARSNRIGFHAEGDGSCEGNGGMANVLITNHSTEGSSWMANYLCGTSYGYWVRGNDDNDGHQFGRSDPYRRSRLPRFFETATPIRIARQSDPAIGDEGPNGGIRPPTISRVGDRWIATCNACTLRRYEAETTTLGTSYVRTAEANLALQATASLEVAPGDGVTATKRIGTSEMRFVPVTP